MKNSFFTGNRQRLVVSTQADVIVLSGWTSMQWHGDTAAPFRQEANFWYLSGIEYADWRLVIDGKQGTSWLIAPEIDATRQLFDGSLSFAAAKAISGVDEVLDSTAGKQLLVTLAKKYIGVHTLKTPSYARRAGFALNPAPEMLRKELSKVFAKTTDCRAALTRLRAIKQPEEIEVMQRAAALTVGALDAAKNKLSASKHEYEVEAELGYHFRLHNAEHAFDPIVAAGKNACTLHYVANENMLRQEELLLIDTGARLGGYSADTTRTFAISEPTPRQRAIHEAVRSAEQQIIALIGPGLPVRQYLEHADAIMQDALLSLGLMKSRKDTAAYRRYFPHAISHGIGSDVHESLGGLAELQPGMVLTVEPGIYIPGEAIGVRIEDTILVTSSGHDNLTGGLSTDL